jgi:hypothetical protein
MSRGVLELDPHARGDALGVGFLSPGKRALGRVVRVSRPKPFASPAIRLALRD